ncbi:beta-2 adrenergic receptor-like [Ptychodera flava]|uniref:beta-2 adrenergic receptor-like n=1 Tax=Ptychodera flava TaxID=63121 RepID=UPI00396A7140
MAVNWPSVVGLAVVSLPCILLNSVVIAGILLDRSLHSVTNIFIVSLATADLLVGSVVVPLYVAEQNSGPVKVLLNCILMRSFTGLFILASVAHLLLIAIDRYIAITFALRYQTLMTKRRAIAFIVACWVLSILAAFAPFMGWRREDSRDIGRVSSGTCSYVDYMTLPYIVVVFIVWYTIPVIVMVVLYGLIFRTASKQANMIRDIQRSVEHLNHREETENAGSHSATSSCTPSTADHRKAAKVLCAIMGCFFACTLPAVIFLFIDHVTDSGVPTTVANFTNMITFLNSALNPLLYGIGNRQVRGSIRERFQRVARAVSSACLLCVPSDRQDVGKGKAVPIV